METTIFWWMFQVPGWCFGKGWKRMMLRYTQHLHMFWQDRRTIREFFTSFMHFPGVFRLKQSRQEFIMWYDLYSEEILSRRKTRALADMTTLLWFKMIAALKMDAKWILNMTSWHDQIGLFGTRCLSQAKKKPWWKVQDGNDPTTMMGDRRHFRCKVQRQKSRRLFRENKKKQFVGLMAIVLILSRRTWTSGLWLTHQDLFVKLAAQLASWARLFQLCVTGRCFTLPPCSANIVGAQSALPSSVSPGSKWAGENASHLKQTENVLRSSVIAFPPHHPPIRPKIVTFQHLCKRCRMVLKATFFEFNKLFFRVDFLYGSSAKKHCFPAGEQLLDSWSGPSDWSWCLWGIFSQWCDKKGVRLHHILEI